MNAVFVVLAPLAIAIFALVMERFESKVVGTTGDTATTVAETSVPPQTAEKPDDSGSEDASGTEPGDDAADRG